jgi:ribonucleoside-triphosphate reductase (thioredoxin)
LPRFDHVYSLAPYETIDKARYEELSANFPTIDYSKLVTYEHSDETEQKQEIACASGSCDVDMVVPTDEIVLP